ncbi:Uncharacterized protein Rs2_45009 [Raphanus sativus]|nr:Uncharacterized protein Rs2_45009 [Raphanus sativus]
MSHLYHKREDKGKWVATSSGSTRRRPPVKIPPCDNADLIEANKLTLIGRVTNPAIQKPIGLIDWLIQYWNMEPAGRVTGRDLGPELFQFRFETEEDLLSVLRRGPYHYKRWMLILQRWEPVISDSFPNLIQFWIRIHGLPLHYWTKTAVTAVGKELGCLLDDDVERGRVRVGVNGLENLEMRLPLQLPSGEVISVDLEYEKLEKHCFLCFSLRHERDHCPLLNAKIDSAASARGINQENTLRSLEDNKKRRDGRRRRPPPLLQISGESSYGLLVSATDRRIQPSQDNSRQSCYRDVSQRYGQLCPQAQYIGHSDNRNAPSHRRSNEECRPGNSVNSSRSSRTRPPKSQRNLMNSRDILGHQGQVKSRTRDERLEAPPPPALARVETPIELDRALGLLGFASLSL